ncbi:MAG TPA: STAS domain-containing protein [Halanaerobiales bacterium]|nr:STAS domain-containing protein [Halanaerobiales bacterium]
MEINKNILNENKVIVSPQENIDFANSNELKEELISIKEEGYNQIEIDFGEVNSIDSSGLGKLLLFHKRLKEKDGELSIKNIQSDYIKNMFDMIKLNKVIKIDEK